MRGAKYQVWSAGYEGVALILVIQYRKANFLYLSINLCVHFLLQPFSQPMRSENLKLAELSSNSKA